MPRAARASYVELWGAGCGELWVPGCKAVARLVGGAAARHLPRDRARFPRVHLTVFGDGQLAIGEEGGDALDRVFAHHLNLHVALAGGREGALHAAR